MCFFSLHLTLLTVFCMFKISQDDLTLSVKYIPYRTQLCPFYKGLICIKHPESQFFLQGNAAFCQTIYQASSCLVQAIHEERDEYGPIDRLLSELISQ